MLENDATWIIDGSSYLYRAYYALPNLTAKNGQPTGAVYGIVNMLRKLIRKHKIERIVVIFDCKGGSFRNEMYKEYKANRSAMPEELKSQISYVHKIIKAMGLKILMEEGVEADDVIASLVHQINDKKIISTGDKDLMQLVNDDVTVINTMDYKIFTPKEVEAKFGVQPEQIRDYLALVGDTADNIPGVPGVGPKTAIKLLTEYKDLDTLIDNLDELAPKLKQKMVENLDLLELSKKLVSLKTDLKYPDLDVYRKEEDPQLLLKIFNELSFTSWQKDLQTKNKIEPVYKNITQEQELGKLLQEIDSSKIFALDTETTSLDPSEAELVGISICHNDEKAYYIPVGHKSGEQLELEKVIKLLAPILQTADITKIMHNAKYDIEVLHNYGLEINNYQDSMLSSYVYNSTNKHSLDHLAIELLDHSSIKYEDVTVIDGKQLCFSEVEPEVAGKYAAEDAWITWHLFKFFKNEINNDELNFVLNDIELPLVQILLEMERNGVLIDRGLLTNQAKTVADKLEKLSEEIHSLAGEEFNINSPKQLQAILFDKLKLPVIELTKQKVPSTSESVLQELSTKHPLAKGVLEYRGLAKLLSTYLEKLPEQIKATTNRIHTNYQQIVTATGRLSSQDPNLQNIPIKTEQGRNVRNAFIAPAGYKILCFDYSQIELRIMAHLSQDPTLISSFNNDLDIHNQTASKLFNISPEDVSQNQRRQAKIINFGLLYGMSGFGLAKQLRCDQNTANEFIENYFSSFPKVKSFIEQIKQQARGTGYVTTIFGRRLHLPNINSKNANIRKAQERTAINAPMQGSNADLIKLAMIELGSSLKQIDCKMLMQVHDELIFEVAENEIAQATAIIEPVMNKADKGKLCVPLKVEGKVGDSWGTASSINQLVF